ncbi:hypothetical protein EJB05_19534, partial [Eragrostis curvula]
MDHFTTSGRFSKEEEADEEQEDASNSRREIPFMTAAAPSTASSSAAASASSASAASSSTPFRSASAGDGAAGASGSGGGDAEAAAVEKEHMFDKVVTPSDVGKLNRLVIPKQYAEKYFPLDAAANDKGLLLSFEDTAGKQWRFRYSYWNSSQSYVMTKGWSRFVKEKRLVAGDTVSFSRAAAEDARHRLFIDWKRRTDNRDPFRFPRLALPMPHYGAHYSPWGFGGGGGGGVGAGFFMPPSPPATLYEHHRLRQSLDFRGMNYHPAPAVGRQLLLFGSARMPPHAPLVPRAPVAAALHGATERHLAGGSRLGASHREPDDGGQARAAVRRQPRQPGFIRRRRRRRAEQSSRQRIVVADARVAANHSDTTADGTASSRCGILRRVVSVVVVFLQEGGALSFGSRSLQEQALYRNSGSTDGWTTTLIAHSQQTKSESTIAAFTDFALTLVLFDRIYSYRGSRLRGIHASWNACEIEQAA